MNRSQGYVLFATLGFSFILVFSSMLKNTGMSSLEQLLLRFSFGLGILAFLMLFRRKFRFFQRKDVSFFILIGVVYSLFTFTGLSAIAFGTPITVVAALVYTQPIFTAGTGIVFPVLAGFFYALYLWLKRQAATKVEYTPYQNLFYTFLFAVPSIMIIGVILQNVGGGNQLFVGIKTPTVLQLGLLMLFAVFSTILPYGLLNYVRVEEISPTSEGLLLLGDPLLHTLWAMLFFNQYVTSLQYVGAGLILLSAAISLKLAAKSIQ